MLVTFIYVLPTLFHHHHQPILCSNLPTISPLSPSASLSPHSSNQYSIIITFPSFSKSPFPLFPASLQHLYVLSLPLFSIQTPFACQISGLQLRTHFENFLQFLFQFSDCPADPSPDERSDFFFQGDIIDLIMNKKYLA